MTLPSLAPMNHTLSGAIKNRLTRKFTLTTQMNQSVTKHGSIAADNFSFGSETISYAPKGEVSWKYIALGTTYEIDDSDALSTHDATKAHWEFVIHSLLPNHNIIS